MATKRRRVKGDGSVYRQPGSPYWYMAYWVGGRRKVRSTKQTEKADALLVLGETILSLKKAAPNIPASEEEWSFKDIAEEWLKTKLGGGTLPSTKNELRVIVRCHLIPAFGSRHIHLITTSLLEEYMWAKFKGVDYDGVSLPVSGGASQKPLSAAFVRKQMQTLRQIFAFAQDNHLLSNEQPNPVSAVNFRQLRSKAASRQIGKDKVLEKSQVVDLLEAATDEWEELLYRLMAQMGLRIGEAVALKASDYDPATKILGVRRTQRRNPNYTGEETEAGTRTHLVVSDDETKTNAGQRSLKVSGQLDQLIVRQIGSKERRKRLAKSDEPGVDWLMPSTIGTMLSPNSLTKNRWKKALKQAGIPKPLTFHCLRHSFASHQLAEGVPITQVSYWLGHANPQVTLTVYAHSISKQAEEVASLTL